MGVRIEDLVFYTKKTAAAEQISAAIILYFSDESIAAVQTLASAGLQILSDVAKKTGVPTPFTIEALAPPNLWKRARGPANWFKHADNDHDQWMTLHHKNPETYLLEAENIYTALYGKTTLHMALLRAWFMEDNRQAMAPGAEPHHLRFMGRMGLAAGTTLRQQITRIVTTTKDHEIDLVFPRNS
jgi:hypothetical protein